MINNYEQILEVFRKYRKNYPEIRYIVLTDLREKHHWVVCPKNERSITFTGSLDYKRLIFSTIPVLLIEDKVFGPFISLRFEFENVSIVSTAIKGYALSISFKTKEESFTQMRNTLKDLRDGIKDYIPEKQEGFFN
ncbi:hypothetical protein BEH94_02570 [Candidatus Altiarchaeales archaeon WOR_SM1_SCG]|nr:hypothetical protein BEH94_02570 [Candidatus Altiarchaeales archaeon WOR_SM1_SCG]